MTKKQLKERLAFIDVYTEFDKWLKGLGFRIKTIDEGMMPEDNWCSAYSTYVTGLYGAESYKHDVLELDLRFARDREEHKFIFIGGFGENSKVYTLDEFRAEILHWVTTVRDEKIDKLTALRFTS